MRKLTFSEWVAVVVAIVVIGYFFKGALMPFSALESLGNVSEVANIETPKPTFTEENMTNNSNDGLIITDVAIGNGEEVVVGKTIVVNYTGKFTDGTVFDSSIPRGEPAAFAIGVGQVIKGWDEGLIGMKVGGKRTLVISPEKGYGAQEIRNPNTGEVIIPANSTLIFDVELLDVQ